MTSPHELHTTALELHEAGLQPFPCRADGTKAPHGEWKQFQDQQVTRADIHRWWAAGSSLGLGMITGHISRNVILLEVEGRAAHLIPDIAQLAADSSLGELWSRISLSWCETSPSGGIHWLLRIILAPGDTLPGNRKIARRPSTPAELEQAPGQKVQTLAEIKGEGGYVVLAPTGGQVHPTGRPWARIAGGPATPAEVTLDELDALCAIFHAVLDDMPEPATTSGPVDGMWADRAPARDGDITPGDDYEAKTDWADILTPHGWALVYGRGRQRFWRRPGKTIGISASTGHAGDRDRLYVFTTSTEFDAEVPYTKFGAYALLNHAGDHSAAAKALAADGYGHRAERTIPATPTAAAAPRGDSTPATEGALALAPVTHLRDVTIPSDPDALTDTGNALFTLRRHHDRLTYIPDMKRWATWDGTRWNISFDDAPGMQAALETIQQLPTDSPDLATHRKRSLNARSLGNAVAILRTMPGIRRPADAFDAHPHELNTPTGIINLATRQPLPADPTHYHSKITNAGHTPGARAPQWEAFIEWAMCGDLELAAYLQRLVGLSLLGEVREHVLPFLYGGGANGKSVFLETLQAVLGDYATEAPSNLLLTGPDRHPTELALLQGRRIVVMSEINENARFDEAKLKQLTGGDTIAARFMRGDFFAFTPSHLLWLAANHKPRVTAGGHSFWRRLRLIPFDARITDEQKEDGMAARLAREEGPGIIQWALDGLADYQQAGLRDPERVKAATAAYSDEEDHLGRFVDDRLHLGGGQHVVTPQADVRDAYRAWCRAEGETELSATMFGRELKARFGVESIKSHGQRKYVGVTVLADPDQDGPEAHWSDR